MMWNVMNNTPSEGLPRASDLVPAWDTRAVSRFVEATKIRDTYARADCGYTVQYLSGRATRKKPDNRNQVSSRAMELTDSVR